MYKKVFSAFVLASMALTLVATNAGSVSAQQATPAPTAAGTMTAAVDSSLSIPGMGKVTGPLSGEAQQLNGDGATFPLFLYNGNKDLGLIGWNQAYSALTSVKVSYQGVGSGTGKKDLIAQSVDFAGSDSFMTDAELASAKAAGGDVVHIASTVGAIVPVYNIPELKSTMKLTGENLALIYLGTINMWNDAKLVADNPDLANVAQPIATFHRGDSSGTTFNFTTYLNGVSTEWAAGPKAGQDVKWPTDSAGGKGFQGNPGVASAVKKTPYAIGYVELAYTTGLQIASVKNNAGSFVVGDAKGVSAAALGITLPDDMRVVIIGQSKDPNAYPISTFTWLLTYVNQKDAAKASALTRYLWWVTHDGQKYNVGLGYAPLPLVAVQKDEANILKINVGGKQALPTDVATPSAAMAATMAATAQ
ncbi:MAG TPA: phosphate ABC transporter substrate-binding protein PstS [Aggregatilineales bacterium]|nr:phosphate ABC transporter substrate-binding protein PstS [Aggregatilineales bacterium]